MRFFGSGSTLGRRVVLSLGLAAVLGTALVVAQTPPAQTPPPAADPFKFSSEAAVVLWVVKPDQTQAFEDVWKVIRGRLAATDKPDLKALGESLKVYKMPSQPGQPVQYLFLADPASKTASYAPSPFLLYESGLFTERKESDELFAKLNGTLGGNINPMPLTVISK